MDVIDEKVAKTADIATLHPQMKPKSGRMDERSVDGENENRRMQVGGGCIRIIDGCRLEQVSSQCFWTGSCNHQQAMASGFHSNFHFYVSSQQRMEIGDAKLSPRRADRISIHTTD